MWRESQRSAILNGLITFCTVNFSFKFRWFLWGIPMPLGQWPIGSLENFAFFRTKKQRSSPVWWRASNCKLYNPSENGPAGMRRNAQESCRNSPAKNPAEFACNILQDLGRIPAGFLQDFIKFSCLTFLQTSCRISAGFMQEGKVQHFLVFHAEFLQDFCRESCKEPAEILQEFCMRKWLKLLARFFAGFPAEILQEFYRKVKQENLRKSCRNPAQILQDIAGESCRIFRRRILAGFLRIPAGPFSLGFSLILNKLWRIQTADNAASLPQWLDFSGPLCISDDSPPYCVLRIALTGSG